MVNVIVQKPVRKYKYFLAMHLDPISRSQYLTCYADIKWSFTSKTLHRNFSRALTTGITNDIGIAHDITKIDNSRKKSMLSSLRLIF